MKPDLHTTAGKIEDLRNRLIEAVHAGSESAIDKQHAKGKMTARERVLKLVDDGSFIEFDEFARHRSVHFGMEKNRPYGDGVIIGIATIDGRNIARQLLAGKCFSKRDIYPNRTYQKRKSATR